jgi:hypothetical protein
VDKNGAKIGLSVVESAEDGICHRPMLSQAMQLGRFGALTFLFSVNKSFG